MTLADVRDYIASLNITESQRVYMGKLDVKPDKPLGFITANISILIRLLSEVSL